jgi:hypothetical protein
VALFFKDWVILGDRASRTAGLKIFSMHNRSNLKSIFEKLMEDQDVRFFTDELKKELGLQFHSLISRHNQNANNCYWSSCAKLALEGAFLLELLKLVYSIEEAKTFDQSKKSMYRFFTAEDRERTLQQFIDNAPDDPFKHNALACLVYFLFQKQQTKIGFDDNTFQARCIERISKRYPSIIGDELPLFVAVKGSLENRIFYTDFEMFNKVKEFQEKTQRKG